MMKNLLERSLQAINSLLPSFSHLSLQSILHERSAQSQEKKHSHWQRTTKVLLHCRNTRIHSFNNSVQSDLELNQLWKSLASHDSSTPENEIEGYCPSPLNITAHTLADGLVQTKLISKTYLVEIRRRKPSKMQSYHQIPMWSLTVIPPKSRHECWLGWQDKTMLLSNSPMATTYTQSLLQKYTAAP